VIVLTDKGRVQSMTERARQWVKDYFGKACSHQAHHLPENLQGWVTHQELQLAQEDKVPSPRQPLVVEHEGKRLVVRFVGDRVEGRYLLLLEEQRTAFSVSSLEPLSLTRRETEVLFWVAQGKTNPEIGTILGVSARTVQTHLEHVYRKLGVETRTAATMQALEMLGLLRR
jgi:DNA-binding CsgD family transcriptional regulator